VGIADALKGQIPVGFVVLKSGVNRTEDELRRELTQLVRDRLGPVASFKQLVFLSRLPKTRSGKILRRSIRSIAVGETEAIPATIEEPAALGELAEALRAQTPSCSA
jgi:propionyl-CoA synthetase